MSVNVFSEGNATDVDFVSALQLVRVLNLDPDTPRIHGVLLLHQISWDVQDFGCGSTPICTEVDRLVESGVPVVVAAGNRGWDQASSSPRYGSISDPGNARRAITVGSTNRRSPLVWGPSYFSGRGPTIDGRAKPDLLAPGEKICLPWTSSAADGRNTERRDGTDYAAAHVAGVIAGVLSVQPDLDRKPDEIKDLLLRTAVDLGRDPSYQGAGLVDALAAVREATVRTDTPVRVFVSYSHMDRDLMDEFDRHLSPMVRGGLIDLWWDKEVTAGTRWEPRILGALEAADIVVLLVSSYFVSSDYAYGKEFESALERERRGDVRIVPIKARPVDVTPTSIAAFQAPIDLQKAVTSYDDPHEAWAEIAAKLREVVVELRGA